MKKILFVSGSARNGNCKAILENLQKNFWLEYSTDLVFIRDYNIAECKGCNGCANTPNNECVIDDLMKVLLEKIIDADIVVLATPNYFYNVSGLTKTFLDRTYSCYHNSLLKGKKFIYIYIGEDVESTTKKYLDNAMYGFTISHGISVLGSYAISAGDIKSFSNQDNMQNTLEEITSTIQKNLINE